MTVPASVHVVIPEGVDDPSRPSGGNAYDRQVCDALAAAGWTVCEHEATGSWPHPGHRELDALGDVLTDLPGGATVLIDGLIASAALRVLEPTAPRLRLIVLIHMPLGMLDAERQRDEQATLSIAAAVVTTSSWTRQWLLDRYRLPPERVHVAHPGVIDADLTTGSDSGHRLLCVAAVMPHKGHDVLMEALAMVADRWWRCDCVGALSRDPGFVADVRRQNRRKGIDDRVRFTGPLTGADLDAAYAAADLLVTPSRAETYGMVVTEALARGIPVLTSHAGGLPEALGVVAGGRRPGLLTPPGDAAALTEALSAWLGDADLRDELRRLARERRAALSGWSTTADRIARVLSATA